MQAGQHTETVQMALRSYPNPEAEDIRLHDVLFALSDPTRLSIAALLADGREVTSGELDVPVSKSTLSHHLRILREAGVTRTRTEGLRCYISFRWTDLEQRFPGMFDLVLRYAGEAEVVEG
jgi:DNA-binding transcriptional ArsR family regulator